MFFFPVLRFMAAGSIMARGGQQAPPADATRGVDGRDFPFVPRDPLQPRRARQHGDGVAAVIDALGRRGELMQTSGEADFRLFNGSFVAARDPLPTDDETKGIDTGAIWVNTETHDWFLCANNAEDNAVWRGPY